MKAASTTLQNLLIAKNVKFICDLYTFTLTSGAVLRYTTADMDIGDGNGNTFTSKGPYFEKFATHKGFHAKTGLDTDSWEVTVMPRMSDPLTGAAYPDMIGDVPWMQGVVAGILDGATVQIDRGYFAAAPKPPWGLNNPFPPVPTGILSKLFVGRVGQITFTRTTATITINSWLNLLSTTKMPANLYGSSCRHTLFDAGCTLSAANFSSTTTVVVQPGYNSQTLLVGNVADFSVPVALGRITMNTGACAGLQKRILAWAGPAPGYGSGTNQVTLDYPFPFQVNEGDSCTIYTGCDKSMATCTLYNNLINYGGFPFIPVPELGY